MIGSRVLIKLLLASFNLKSRQIVPGRVLSFDQVALPVAPPALELLLARDRRLHRLGDLEIDQSIDPVLPGVAVEGAGAVLQHPADQVRGYPDIERAVVAVG